MRSIKEIFVIGNGPSSSHTMGPSFASQYILKTYKNIKFVKVTLCGSLALTGKGHLTDFIIHKRLENVQHEIIFDINRKIDHPNTMYFETTTTDNKVYNDTVVSIGGGSIVINGKLNSDQREIYPHNTMTEIHQYCEDNKITLYDYVKKFEDKDIEKYISKVITVMQKAIKRGVKAKGVLPGKLKVQRKAREMRERIINSKNKWALADETLSTVVAAFAVAEENASGGEIVTAPTCGSAGVIPGCLCYLIYRGVSKRDLIKYMMVAGLIGIVAKTNSSVSGAECGCQAEIGVACAMGAAMIEAYYNFEYPGKIIQAAEIGLEHSLGLTCDPVEGYVQIPCIERCAMFALKALNAAKLATLLPHLNTMVSFDESVKTMLMTGKAMNSDYRETAKGGLATLSNEFKENKNIIKYNNSKKKKK